MTRGRGCSHALALLGALLLVPGVPRLARAQAPKRPAAAALSPLAPSPDTTSAAAPPSFPSLTPLQTREIAPGVFVYAAPYALAERGNDGAVANLGFVVGRDAVAVIDTGGSLRAGLRLKAAIRARTALPIRFVINTHVHPDHLLGNGAFLGEGARFVGHAKLARALAARAETYMAAAARDLGAEEAAGIVLVPPDLAVEGALDLDLGGRSLRLEAQPTAHTDNDLTVLDAATGTWFLGDLLFLGHLPVVDGRIAGWLAFIARARDLPAARVVPGHGPASAPWPAALEPQGRYLGKLDAEVRVLIREGRSMAEAARVAGLSERDAWALFETFNARNAVTVYKELEWE